MTAVYFIAVPYITNGRTLGKGIVRIRIAGAVPGSGFARFWYGAGRCICSSEGYMPCT
ncbi:hypothetical protein LJK88_24080 [Paenibacillus sp. P26]|nr:hypothetical protein LJK88_24080 [Paenibacillus sp. P26]